MPVSTSGTFHHTCFIVRDIEAVASRLCASAGIGPWHVWTITPESGTLHGRPAAYAFRVAIAEHGAASYELITPVSGESVYDEHLEAHGEGFHHTCHIFDTREAMQAEKVRLIGAGREMIQDGNLGQLGEFCYFAIPETGAALELLFLEGLPPPEKCIA